MNALSPERRRSVSGLVADLWRESIELIREEAALAKAEVSDKVSHLGAGMVWLAAGAAVLFAGLALVLVAAVAGLAQLLPEELGAWLAPLIAGAVVVPLGLLLLERGRKIMTSTHLNPAHSMRSLRKDVGVLKEHIQ